MYETLRVQLPEEMAAFVRAETAALGMQGESDYILTLLKNERSRKVREQIAALIDEGLQGEPRELTERDWEELRQRAAGRS